MWGKNPGNSANKKYIFTQSMHCIGRESCRKSKYPNIEIEQQPVNDLWKATDDSYIKTCNINCDRFVFFSSRQQKGESVESFYGHLIEQAENCSLGDEKITLIRDESIFNMQDHDTQWELLKETVSPSKALEVAIHMERGITENKSKLEHCYTVG